MAIPNSKEIWLLKLHMRMLIDKMDKLKEEIKKYPSWVKGSTESNESKLSALRKELEETAIKMSKIKASRFKKGLAAGTLVVGGLAAFDLMKQRKAEKAKLAAKKAKK
jgi:hypothetical protein